MGVWNWTGALVRPLLAPVESRMAAEAARNAGQSAWDMHLNHQAKAEAGWFDPPDQTPPPKMPEPRMSAQPNEARQPVLP